MITDIKQWLTDLPNEELVSKNNDGSEFIPIGNVLELLDELTNYNWSTKNFQFRLMEVGGLLFVSGSIEITVLDRTVVGCATRNLNDYPDNYDYEATLMAETIKNGCKQLGNRFGRHLNGRVFVDAARNGKRIKASPQIRKQYAVAINQRDAIKIEEFEHKYDFTI